MRPWGYGDRARRSRGEAPYKAFAKHHSIPLTNTQQPACRAHTGETLIACLLTIKDESSVSIFIDTHEHQPSSFTTGSQRASLVRFLTIQEPESRVLQLLLLPVPAVPPPPPLHTHRLRLFPFTWTRVALLTACPLPCPPILPPSHCHHSQALWFSPPLSPLPCAVAVSFYPTPLAVP